MPCWSHAPRSVSVRRSQGRDAPNLSQRSRIGGHPSDDRRMVLEFDEYVKASNWRSQLLVSPPLDGAVELEVRGREVWVSWDEALRPQTTYVFQFGDAIADVNEGNAATNLRHAFSTGPVLDTLSIRGRVLDALTGDAQPGMRVMLFPGSWAVDSVWQGPPRPTWPPPGRRKVRRVVFAQRSVSRGGGPRREPELRVGAWGRGRAAGAAGFDRWTPHLGCCGLGPRLALPPRTCLRPCETTGAGRRGA